MRRRLVQTRGFNPRYNKSTCPQHMRRRAERAAAAAAAADSSCCTAAVRAPTEPPRQRAHGQDPSEMWAQRAAQLLLLALLLLPRPRTSLVAGVQLQSCVDAFDVHKDKIIRTEDSLKLGAVYLAEYEVDTRLECIRWCCETDNCDVFVFEDKKAGGCYLFQCGPPHDFKCKFTNHANYSSAVLTDHSLLRAPDAIDELKSLRQASGGGGGGTTTSGPTSAGPATSSAASPTASSPGGASSSRPTASCSRNQFECRSSDDCIAIYNVCDGIPQCADGSDEALELGCPQERASVPPPPPPPPPRAQQPRPELLPPAYERPAQRQRYPLQLYPDDQRDLDAWPNYQPRGYAAPGPAPRPQQALDYRQWQPEQPGPDDYQPQQQAARVFEQRPAGVRLEDLQSANGLYAREPSRGYAPYYPAVIGRPETSWQEGLAPPREAQPRQQSVVRPAPATAAPRPEHVPYQQPEPQRRASTTSSAPPPCDSSESRQPAVAHDQQQQQQQQQQHAHRPNSSEAATGDESSAEHQARGLQVKTVAQARLQEHKSITIVDHLGRAAAVAHASSSRIDQLDLSRPRGAVISLALGLSVTAIMAVLIACRLRVVKRRGRGRSHDSYAHDTDYLVNGMYL